MKMACLGGDIEQGLNLLVRERRPQSGTEARTQQGLILKHTQAPVWESCGVPQRFVGWEI
jgi:hypothetical protein